VVSTYHFAGRRLRAGCHPAPAPHPRAPPYEALLRPPTAGRFAPRRLSRYIGQMGRANRSRPRPAAADEPIAGLRIIGGSLRGRKLQYSGEARTRPMKDRVRESVFNLLGPQVAGSHTIDLFAGTGALALEAISRGAAKATLIERHFPTVKLIEQNVAQLGVGERAEVVFGDAFAWTRRYQPVKEIPLTVFCSPPYDFYVERRAEMLDLIGRWTEIAPPGSQIVVEADARFDLGSLPDAPSWDVRGYPPAVVAIYRKHSP
jgi:16S rRNA (guanine966-N2)-methyltransferase